MTPQPEQPRDHRGFAGTLVIGVIAAVLAAVACAKPWAALAGLTARTVPPGAPELTGAGQSPVAAAVALVVLACWGAVLVTRGRVRTGMAVLGLAAAVALLSLAVRGAWTAQDDVRNAVEPMLGSARHAAAADVARTGWYWLALVASVACVLTYARAVPRARHWPTMSTRYDAPGTRADGPSGSSPAGGETAAPQTNREWWQAIDEGRDPTAPPES